MTEMADRTVVRKPDIVPSPADRWAYGRGILLIHSSMKASVMWPDGPLAVIEAAMEAVTERGTVVFPTLVQRDFAHAYLNWTKARSPSDVGLISETFRRMAGTLRSDQATTRWRPGAARPSN
jgi:aminoglycoside N3'-acetyltransferase